MSRHLIHVGFPATGAEFLQSWFAGHPQIAFDPAGIGGCRDVYELVRQAAAPGRQCACRVTSFEGLVTPHVNAGLPRGDEEWEECRPDAEAQQRTCATLAALFPRAWILLITRGFRSIAPSGWDYDAAIDLYEAAFGDRLIVLPFELLRDRPAAFTAEIEGRLGLDHFAPAPQSHASSLSAEGLRTGGRRLGMIVRLRRRLRPATAATPEPVADIRDLSRGRAERLRDNPLYAPYREDYFL